ncbi:hypothetical protein EVAR_67645_1 [Eumeta japonica]|uniref:Uncharacterized protein n=1 Tax=Eumeta variegata TaxID=151549 RepID=A0A4C1Z625_EUMVA|nr:hypothetical protein EVAR_67645_1 [Eumeta japonica]
MASCTKCLPELHIKNYRQVDQMTLVPEKAPADAGRAPLPRKLYKYQRHSLRYVLCISGPRYGLRQSHIATDRNTRGRNVQRPDVDVLVRLTCSRSETSKSLECRIMTSDRRSLPPASRSESVARRYCRL